MKSTKNWKDIAQNHKAKAINKKTSTLKQKQAEHDVQFWENYKSQKIEESNK